MDITEASLEQLIKKQRNIIETKISALNSTEISIASNKIPTTHTMLEYREFRTRFLKEFNSPLEMPQSITYSDELLNSPKKNIEFPTDQRQFLLEFFQKEIDRVKEISQIVSTRIFSPEVAFKNQTEYSAFMDAVSHHFAVCEEGLERLSAQTLMTFNANDLFLELTNCFLTKRRKAMFLAYLSSISQFPMTNRTSIFKTLFNDTEKMFLRDTSQAPFPMQIIEEEPLDKELIRLARRFGLNPDLEIDDGQKFVYHANKTFESMWPLLNTFNFPKKNIQIPEYSIHPSFAELTQRSIISQAPRDFRIQTIISQLAILRDDEISLQIREISQYYNTSVGNQVRGQSTNYEKNKKLLPLHKISAWLELRFVHMKFLACSILAIINYFEYVRYKLSEITAGNIVGKSTAAKLRIGHSPALVSLIEICDENGPFLFQSATVMYEELKDTMVAIGSYHLGKADPESANVPDREAIIEKILQYEFRFLNAKRKLVQSLLEALDHGKNENLICKIHETIEESPFLNLPIFKSFDVPFEAAIELMERRANLLREMVNLQILHERQVSTQIPELANIFDRPLCLNATTARMFDESVPISPFEVYTSLSMIYKFLEVIPRVVNDIGESSDFKMTKFGIYLEIAVLKEVEILQSETIQHGYFPFDRPSTNFKFLLSDSVNSLFTSPFVNNLNAISSLMTNMNEGRKLRFLLSARKFVTITWKLQKMIIKTNQLQTAYFQQCDIIGISERSVLLSSFKDNAKKELIDMNTTSSNDKIIDFALTEFETISINFSSQSTIKDIIFVGTYDKLNEIMKFQRLQNVILEVAVRYNFHLIDSDYFVNFFDLDERKVKEENDTIFLTAANDTETAEDPNNPNKQNESSNQSSFYKQFLAAQMFTMSTALYRDNQIAYEDKNVFSVPIKFLKMRARSFLAGQYKQKELPNDELIELYINEMIDSFSCFMYRSEMAHITNLERQILLANSFVDTFVLGPDPTTCLVNEAGRFEKFFYVPTWVECFRMMQSAPTQRQSIVLKPALHFVVSRYQLLSLIRFEASMLMKSNEVFDSLYEAQFSLESPVFQKLFNEFGRLPSAREIDVSSNYISDRLKYFFYRFEQTIMSSFESFFVSLNVEAKRMPTPSNEKNIKVRLGGVSDPRFGDIIKKFWLQMHQPYDNHLMTIRRYIPHYQDEFIYNLNEIDRNEMITTFQSTDATIDEAIVALRNNSFMDTFQLLPSLLDFLKSAVSLHQMKFALFLLLHRIPETEITPVSSVLKMSQEIYVEGTPIWNDLIMDEAMQSLVSRDEPIHQLQDAPSVCKIQDATFDQMRNQIDIMLLSNQMKSIQASINKFSSDFSTLHEKSTLAFKPDFLVNDNILNAPVHDQIFVIAPHEADRQFQQENLYSHAKFVDFVANALDACTLERRDHDGTYSTIFDGDGFEESCHKLTTALEIFSKGSLSDLNMTWKQYIATVASQLHKNTESMKIIGRIIDYTHQRFERQTESEVGLKFADQIFQLNSLNDRLHSLNQTREQRDNEIADELTQYFENLLVDIGKEIETKKSMFSGIKQDVYEGVVGKISSAKQVQLKVDHSNTRGEATSVLNNSNDKMLQNLVVENDESKKKVLQLRVLRCLNEISVTRYFKKRLAAVENDRKQANASLWSNKLAFETQEVSMMKQLEETRSRLTETEIEVEKLKQQLENEKMSNIQLVHWKAKNLKTIDNLKKSLSDLKKVGDVNIDELLSKLSEKQSELDDLRAESDEIDRNIEEAVKKPMKKIDQIRNQMIQTRAERSELIQTITTCKDYDERIEREMTYQLILDENAQLKHSNILLKAQIDDIEIKKEKKAFDVKNFMERTTQPPPPTLRSVSKIPGIIIKPSVVGRSLSRI